MDYVWLQQLISRPKGRRKCWFSTSQNFLEMHLSWKGLASEEEPHLIPSEKRAPAGSGSQGEALTRQSGPRQTNPEAGRPPSLPFHWAR